MLWEHERYYGLGMHALVTLCSRNTNVIMVWVWMLCQPYALEHERYTGLGTDGERMLSEHERHYGLGMDALVSVCSRNTNVIMVWDGSCSERMLSKHEPHYGLGMDALVSVCSRNTNVIMVRARMLW